MAKQVQAIEEKRGLIAESQVAYEQLMDEIRGYCQQARQLREQAEELQRSGRTNIKEIKFVKEDA